MPAVVEIVSHHGAAGATQADVAGTSIRFKVADNDTVDANNPIPIVAATTSRSWIKQFRYKTTTAPSNNINNLKLYSDGANGLGTGQDIKAKTNASYTDPIANGTTALGAGGGLASLFTFTSGSALAVTGSTTTTGLFGDYVQTQYEVLDTATQGTSGSEVMTFAFDES